MDNRDKRRCSVCDGDIEETFTTRTCHGCGLHEVECVCLDSGE